MYDSKKSKEIPEPESDWDWDTTSQTISPRPSKNKVHKGSKTVDSGSKSNGVSSNRASIDSINNMPARAVHNTSSSSQQQSFLKTRSPARPTRNNPMDSVTFVDTRRYSDDDDDDADAAYNKVGVSQGPTRLDSQDGKPPYDFSAELPVVNNTAVKAGSNPSYSSKRQSLPKTKTALPPGDTKQLDSTWQDSDQEEDAEELDNKLSQTAVHADLHSEIPPYDFSREVPDERKFPRIPKPPGKSRKGNLYNPTQADDYYDMYDQDMIGGQYGRVIPRVVRNPRTSKQEKPVLEEEEKHDGFLSNIINRVRRASLEIANEDRLMHNKTLTLSEKNNTTFTLDDEKPLAVADQHKQLQFGEGNRYIYIYEDMHREFVHSNDHEVEAYLPRIAERAEQHIRRGWQEVFALLRMVLSLFLIFIVELVQFLLHNIVLGLVLRILALLGDYLFKPLLTTVFNAFVHPLSIFLWNIFLALFKAVGPLIDIMRGISKQVALVLGSFRLVDITTQRQHRDIEHV